MSKTEEMTAVLKALVRLISVIVIATVAIDVCFGVLTGFRGELTSYPYTKGKLY